MTLYNARVPYHAVISKNILLLILAYVLLFCRVTIETPSLWQGNVMKKEKSAATKEKKRFCGDNILERLLEKYAADEIGLLDLVFIDEILAQKADEDIKLDPDL